VGLAGWLTYLPSSRFLRLTFVQGHSASTRTGGCTGRRRLRRPRQTARSYIPFGRLWRDLSTFGSRHYGPPRAAPAPCYACFMTRFAAETWLRACTTHGTYLHTLRGCVYTADTRLLLPSGMPYTPSSPPVLTIPPCRETGGWGTNQRGLDMALGTHTYSPSWFHSTNFPMGSHALSPRPTRAFHKRGARCETTPHLPGCLVRALTVGNTTGETKTRTCRHHLLPVLLDCGTAFLRHGAGVSFMVVCSDTPAAVQTY